MNNNTTRYLNLCKLVERVVLKNYSKKGTLISSSGIIAKLLEIDYVFYLSKKCFYFKATGLRYNSSSSPPSIDFYLNLLSLIGCSVLVISSVYKLSLGEL